MKNKKTKKRSYTKRATANGKTAIDALVNAVEEQSKTISNLIDVIKGKGVQALNYVKDYRNKSAVALPIADRKTNDEFFLECLRQIGRPATTWEIANTLKKMNPHFQKLARNKKSFMQLIYTSASQLSKAGTIDRKPVGQRSYEYGLHDWKVAA